MMSSDNRASPSDVLGGIVERIEANHARILAVCEGLEGLADGLPGLAAAHHHLVIVRRLSALLRDAHAFEEQEFHPRLDGVLDTAETSWLDNLTEEHRHDEAFADEVGEVLLEWAVGDRRVDADTLGYMLRGLFDNLRRHIGRERDHLLDPVIRRIRSPL